MVKPGGTLTLAVFDERSGWALSERYAARLSERAGDAWRVRAVASRAELLEAMGETVGLVGLPLTEEQLRPDVGRLRWLQLARSSGDASPPVEVAIENGVRVTSAATPRAPQVAEHALALALAMLRRLDVAIARQREHVWSAKELAPLVRTLAGATISVVAAPPLVRALAPAARALGASVHACVTGAPGAEDALDEENVVAQPVERINEALGAGDVVIVGAPRTEMTIGLVGRKAMNAMKRTAVLVDVSKGGIVEEGPLIEALRRQRISAAALDVFSAEPLPSTSPFWTMANVIVTPHVAAAGDAFWDRLIDHAGDNARRLAAGEPLVDELAPALYQTA
jgi:D-2-hydroxyacid dehydrogenase (NADP+)